MPDDLPALTADDLKRLAREARAVREAAAAVGRAGACDGLRCAGWESLPAAFDAKRLVCVGLIASPALDDPYVELTLAEHHPAGTRYDAPDAPIATGHFPYNRCEVWRCADGSRVFLRYTEVGGYYVDMRIREVDEALIVDTAAPPSPSPAS